MNWVELYGHKTPEIKERKKKSDQWISGVIVVCGGQIDYRLCRLYRLSHLCMSVRPILGLVHLHVRTKWKRAVDWLECDVTSQPWLQPSGERLWGATDAGPCRLLSLLFGPQCFCFDGKAEKMAKKGSSAFLKGLMELCEVHSSKTLRGNNARKINAR